jgi:hypothetical protein
MNDMVELVNFCLFCFLIFCGERINYSKWLLWVGCFVGLTVFLEVQFTWCPSSRNLLKKVITFDDIFLNNSKISNIFLRHIYIFWKLRMPANWKLWKFQQISTTFMIMRENNGKIVSMGTGLSKYRHNEPCPLLFF